MTIPHSDVLTAEPSMEPPHKRTRLDQDIAPDPALLRIQRASFLSSLSRRVSPPCQESVTTHKDGGTRQMISKSDTIRHDSNLVLPDNRAAPTADSVEACPNPINKIIPSPFQLTRIRDLPANKNIDTISLHEILGDPLIKEAWIFNFCFDVDWTMQHFDSDVRELVKVKIIHGSWRREDINKINIDEACAQWPNVETIQAYLPDPFGTHHSKMFILFRHDETAQIIIHTANMLKKDWTNMTQAVWRSPLLPELRSRNIESGTGPPGTGSRFKHDLLQYLKSYGSKLKSLTQQVISHDFDEVKAALVASVPSDFAISETDDKVWGHEKLRRVMKCVPITFADAPHFVFQVSSIASLPSTWLRETLYNATGSGSNSTSIIYPTADDVSQSLDGYAAGGSIHTKAQKDIHLKQISAIRPQLCRWTEGPLMKASRHLAAPHIKTYVRFTSQPSLNIPTPEIDWALITSANLSTQAWGTTAKLPKGTKDACDARVKIQSFEIGVLVWPKLFAVETDIAAQKRVRLVPTFQKDMPGAEETSSSLTIGFRMPYDLPLSPYASGELPWSPQSAYSKPDRHGMTWSPE